MNQPILLYRSGSVYANETAAWAALDAVTHKKGQPIVAFYTLSSSVSGHHGSSTIGAIFAIGIGDGVGQYKACTSHDDMLIVAQSLNAHITQFNQMFEYDATNNAIKAKLDFYTTDGKSISAGGIGGGSSASLGALYQLVDVMANSSNTGVEGAVEGSVLAYDATAGKWKAIAQSEILPDMSGYYTKDETDSAINTAKSNLQGQVDTLKALIPATATADNQLADKDFVNSSIATATAEFRGSFTSLDELKATSGNLNDYAFYLHTDDVGNKVVDRYKWTTAGWLYEYTLNNSSFTAEQWAALNSAITATLVQSYNSHLNNSAIHITSGERTAWNNKWDYNEDTIKGVKVNAAVSADKATKLATARTIWGQSFDGSANVFGNFTLGYYKIYLSNGNNAYYIGWNENSQLIFKNYYDIIFSTYAERLRITSDGNILIGTTTDNGYKLDVNGTGHYSGDLICGGEVVAVAGEGTPAGVTDYSALTGKPSINGVTLVSGNNTLAALGIQAAGDYATNSGVTTLLANYADKTFVSNNYAGKSAFNTHAADTDIHITSAERTTWNAKWDYDEATIKAVKVTSASSADSVAWSGIKGKPTSLKNPYALTFGSKTYDGSAAATITASDLGALTAHQSIYAFTLQVNGTSKGTYNPASAAKTINIAVPTKTSDITNDSGFITSAAIPTALKNPYAVEIKANGVSLGTYDGSTTATFNLSAANVGAASKVHSHNASEISGLPTKLSAFNNDVGFITGITKSMVEGVLTGNITSHTHSYLPLSGGTIKGDILSSNMNVGIRWNVDYLGGWARNFLEFNAHKDNDATKALESVFKIGGYGKDTGYVYTYIGAGNSYDSAYNIRFYSNNTITIGAYEILHANNYNSYSPKLDGTGASGTWGISISGNAATATNADKLDGVHYQNILERQSSGASNSGTATGWFRIAESLVADSTGITFLLAIQRDYWTTPNESYLFSISINYNGGINITQLSGYANNRLITKIRVDWATTKIAYVDLYINTSTNQNVYYWYTIGSAKSYTEWTANPTLVGTAYEFTTVNGCKSDRGFTGDLVGNSSSATKLQTPRTIWGQSFDGSANIGGDLYIQNGALRINDKALIYVSNNISVLGNPTQNTYLRGNITEFQYGASATTGILLNSSGNVLIGTNTDKGYKLQVNGSERVYGDLIVDGEVSALVA